MTRVSQRTDYETDFVAWADQQAALLRARRFDGLDIDNLAEEIESLARSDRRELRHRLDVLLAHLIKLAVLPNDPSRRQWQLTVREQRRQIQRLLEDSPSLVPALATLLEKEWPVAAADAEEEAGARVELRHCPWHLEQMLSDDFCPSARA